MQSEDGECLSPDPADDQIGSVSEGRGAGPEDELDFEGDFPAEAEDAAERTEPACGKEEGEDGEVAESDEGQGEDDDLEEGELKEEDEEGTSAGADVCKYYPRGSCTWGDDCRFTHSAGLAGNRRNVPLLRQPVQAYGTRCVPMQGLKGPPRTFYPAMPLPPPALAVPVQTDAMASSWERGLRSAKERVAKAKERKETESDFDDKRLNLTVPDETAHRSQSSRHVYPVREPASHMARDRRSPVPDQRSSYHSSSTSHHYPSSSSYYQQRDYRHSHSHQSHDESEYERRQRLAYMSAPRPEEWNDQGRPRPPSKYPLLDRYGREIQRCSRPDDYVDKWKRSPVRKLEKPVREAGDLSSISTSDSPSGLSGTSDTDSEGSWSDDEKDRKRVNHRTKTSAAVSNPELKPAATSGMKRIPRLSDRQPPRDRPSPKRHPHLIAAELPRSDAASISKSKGLKDGDRSRSYRSSLSSESEEDAENERSKAEKRKGALIPHNDAKRKRDSHHSNGSPSPVSRHSLSPRASPNESLSSPRREKERFVMDFVGKSQRLKPAEVADALNNASSEEEDDEERSGQRSGSVDKAAERKKLLEQLKAVEAAIAAKKQPLKVARRKI